MAAFYYFGYINKNLIIAVRTPGKDPLFTFLNTAAQAQLVTMIKNENQKAPNRISKAQLRELRKKAGISD